MTLKIKQRLKNIHVKIDNIFNKIQLPKHNKQQMISYNKSKNNA